MDPVVGVSSPLMQRSSVLFPEPEGPMMTTTSFSLTLTLISFKTVRSPNFLLMWVISIRFFSSAIYFFSNIATTLEIASVMMRYRTATVDHISKEP